MDTGGDADGAGNCGGNAGTSTSGGAAPDDTASAGTLGQGGHGGGDGSFGGFPGGGGGGGLYGGGGGDGGYTGSSCGGGGGSSMGDTVTLDDTAIPKITIAWTPVPEASVSPSFLAFATQTVGTASSSQTVTVTNSGSAPLTISGTSVSGNNPADFAVSSGCPGNVAPQSSCSLTVAFTPGDTGTRSASLVLNTNASSSPSNVALAGSGAAVSAGPPPAIRAPGLSALRLRPAAFRAALRGPSLLSATSRGAALSWTDTSASTVTFAVLRSVKGIRSGSRCVARPRKPRHGAKSCTRLVAVGSFTATDVAGANSRRFSGRVKGHALKPGSYVLRLVAVANGLKSAAVQTKFRIVR
jgi:hypothetical protein